MQLAILILAAAEVTTSATEFSADGKSYLKEYVWDDSGASTESLYVKEGDKWTLVGSLYTDVDGNWTGFLNGVQYADLWSDEAGDYVVIIGAETWPTWSDFDAALSAAHFWDDGGIVYDGVLEDGIVFFALSASTGEPTEATTSEARPGQKGLMNALAQSNGNPKKRIALLTALVNPTPKDVFPALAKSGNKSPRAKQ